MTGDRLVFTLAAAGAMFLFGLYAGEQITIARYADTYLTPCPKHIGFLNTSSVWSKQEGQQCFYKPEVKRIPGKPSRKA